MRNKWFVGGILVPAVCFTWGTVMALRSDTFVLAIVPAAIALGLYAAAYKVSQSNSFSPAPPARWDSGTSNAVKQWNVDRDARDAAASKATAVKPAKKA